MPPDHGLFKRLWDSVARNVTSTCCLDVRTTNVGRDDFKFSMNQPIMFWESVCKTWESHPTNAVVLQECQKWDDMVDEIIAVKGDIVKSVKRSGHRAAKKVLTDDPCTGKLSPEARKSFDEMRDKMLAGTVVF